MSLEKLVVLTLIFILLFALVGWAVPAPVQRMAYIVVGAVAVIVLLWILLGGAAVVRVH